MKRILFGLLVILTALIACVYIFIPGLLNVSSVVVVNCTINGTNRYLLDASKWSRWWPGGDVLKAPPRGSPFSYDGSSYQFTQPLHNGLEMHIEHEGLRIKSVVNNFPLSRDSVAIQWKYSLPTSYNPFTRWKQYRQARRIKWGMDTVLAHLQSFLGRRGNVYGVDIKEIYAGDTTLIVTRDTSDAYPPVAHVYDLIRKLKNHVITENALETNYPMLHIREVEGGRFETMVAIPVNKPVKENRYIVNKRFVPWKTLVGEVKGGVYTIDQAYKQMEVFLDDYQRMPMAIPFELMVTDRSLEPDTSKWISIVCQPVS